MSPARSEEIPDRIDAEDFELLRRVTIDGDYGPGTDPGERVKMIVHGCAYECCARGWMRRDGYEQTYFGYIDNLTDATVMLYGAGIGTSGYVIAARFDEIDAVETLNG